MKRLCTFVLLLHFCGCLFSQSGIVSSGGEYSNSDYSLSYSVGQLHFANTSSLSGALNEGVQQPIELYHLEINVDGINSPSIFPNPTYSGLVINTENNLGFAITNLSGKILLEGEILAATPVINVRTLSTGTYLLRLNHKTVTYQYHYKFIKL